MNLFRINRTVFNVLRLFKIPNLLNSTYICHVRTAKAPFLLPHRVLSVIPSAKHEYNPHIFEKDAFSVLEAAEKQRIRLLSMSNEEKESFFENLWQTMLKDKNLRISLIGRYLQFKSDFNLPISYENWMDELQKQGLKPDDRFYGVFMRKSCEKGDMEKASFYLKEMHQHGIVPNKYIFSKILHGYVKCGLPDEVATTQDIMSKLNFWPSTLATESLLTGYADLGDGSSVVEIIKETLAKEGVSVEYGTTVFPARFISELYTRLASSPQFDINDQHANQLLDILKLREPNGDDFRLGIPFVNLVNAGHSASAEHLLKVTSPHQFSSYFLNVSPRLLAKEGPEFLNKFWSITGNLNNLPERSRTMPLDCIVKVIEAKPNIRADAFTYIVNGAIMKAVKAQDEELIVRIGNSIDKLNLHMFYLGVIPTMLSSGMKSEQIISKFEGNLKSAAALGCVLNELCANSPESTDDVEKSVELIAQLQTQSHLPFPGYLPNNNYLMKFLLRGLLQHAAPNEGKLAEFKMAAWTDALFSCFIPETHTYLATGLLCSCFAHDNVIKEGKKPKYPVISFDEAKNIGIFLNSYIQTKKIPVGNLDFLRTQMRMSGLPMESYVGLTRTGNLSQIESIACRIHSSELESVITELQTMPSVNLSEYKPSDLIVHKRSDLFDEAIVASNSLKTYTSTQLERLFWELYRVGAVRNVYGSIRKLREVYIKAADINGLLTFAKKIATDCPRQLDAILDRNSLADMVLLDREKTRQFVDEVLKNDSLDLVSVASASYYINSLTQDPAVPSKHSVFEGHTEALTKRLENLTQLKKVRAIHNAIENLCHTDMVLVAHALCNWAGSLGLVILPRSTEVLIAASTFIDSHTIIPFDAKTIYIRGGGPGSDVNRIFQKLQETSVSSTLPLHKIINDLATLLSSRFNLNENLTTVQAKHAVFTFWSIISQLLQQPASQLKTDADWSQLATRMIELDGSEAVLDWVSSLVDSEKITAVTLAGLASKSPVKFVELLRKQRELPFNIATSHLLETLDTTQQANVAANFALIEHADLLRLSKYLFANDVAGAQNILENLKYGTENALVGLVYSDMSLLPTALECVQNESAKISLINRILDQSHTSKITTENVLTLLSTCARPNLHESEEVNTTLLPDRISFANQAHIKALFRLREKSNPTMKGFMNGKSYFETIFPGNNKLSKRVQTAIQQRSATNLVGCLVDIQKLEPEKLETAAHCIICSQIINSGLFAVKQTLIALCNIRNPELVDVCTKLSVPFVRHNVDIAFKGLAGTMMRQELDPITLAAISYHKLNEFNVVLVPKTEPVKFESLSLKMDATQNSDSNDPISMAKESVSFLAKNLAEKTLSNEKATSVIEMVRKLWGPGRVDLILCHLANMQSVEAIDQVVDNMAGELQERRRPFKSLVRLIINCTTSGNAESPEYTSMLKELKASPSSNLALCMNGPHITTLFQSWPENHIDDAIDLVNCTSGRSQTILQLQLAASLVHRGLSEKTNVLLKMCGPLPYNYLAGGLQHPLNKSAFLASLKYMREVDSAHVTHFIDASLRNAAICSRQIGPNEAIELVHTVIEETDIDLLTSCQSATLRLLRDCTKKDSKIQEILSVKSKETANQSQMQ